MTTRFPQNPANGTEVSLGDKTWRYNSTYGVWDKVESAVVSGATYEFLSNGLTQNGPTLSIDTTVNISLQGISASQGATFQGIVYALGGISLGAGGITFPDGTGMTRASVNSPVQKNVASFTIQATSSIGTGDKLNSLYKVPFNSTITNFDVKISKTGGFTCGIDIAGSDFGVPETGAQSAATLNITGLTGSKTSAFMIPTLTAENYLFFTVDGNVSGSTSAQAFITYDRR